MKTKIDKETYAMRRDMKLDPDPSDFNADEVKAGREKMARSRFFRAIAKIMINRQIEQLRQVETEVNKEKNETSL